MIHHARQRQSTYARGEVLVITVTALFSWHCSSNGMVGLTNGITSGVTGPTKHLERPTFAQILVKTKKKTLGESFGTTYVIFPADAKMMDFLLHMSHE